MSKGDSPGRYPLAYLITAPRFLGYSFNPVSFWYLYSKEMHLKAMILEVNNTFDERRMYFLKKSQKTGKVNGEDNNCINFTVKWPKDFHVSPFNSRKGSYSLMAHDPFSHDSDFSVDNTVTLSSSKGHSKIVARLYSAEAPLDPLKMTPLQKLSFIGSWWWVGFVTYPRIVKEATKLFFHRKLHVWFRPEVLKSSIGRKETDRERQAARRVPLLHDADAIDRIIEIHFRKYLREIIPQPLRYTAAGSINPHVETIGPSRANDNTSASVPLFQVLTPLFYSQLAMHAHPSALAASILAKEPSAQTVHIDPPAVVTEVMHSETYCRTSCVKQESLLERLRWWLLSALCRSSGPRPLDEFVRISASKDSAQEYARAVVTIRFSALIAGGVPELLDAAWWLARVALTWLSLTAGIRAVAALEQGWAAGGNSGCGDWSCVWATLDLWLTVESTLLGMWID